MSEFTHLHVHTEYSILDGLAKISDLIKKAYADGQRAMAVTDHGNMYAIFNFVREVEKFNGKLSKDDEPFKAIIGCEVYVAARSRLDKSEKIDRSGHHLILLAKDWVGYRNLSRMVSFGFSDGMYYKPRIDKELLRKYHEGVICCSACLGGELPQVIMRHNDPLSTDYSNLDLQKAGEVVEEFKEIFGNDYYLELQRNGHREQNLVNEALLQLGEKHGVRCIATNDVHFTNKEDFDTHRMLLCINTGKKFYDQDSAKQDEDSDGGMAYSGQEYFRTTEEMKELFADHPEVILNTQHIVRKVEVLKLATKATLPKFDIPENFNDEYAYLEYLVREGAKGRYPVMTPEIEERIQFELDVVKGMGFPGYFLIVWDFINAGKKMGIRFGPGRGSAAGSVLAYCMGITNIDPIKYDLLFERFLNPDRISMPDMDIDIDDSGRRKVIEYVIGKYGAERVAQIITFNFMGAKSAIRNCARVLDLPLAESDRLAKLVPDDPKVNFYDMFHEIDKKGKKSKNYAPDLLKETQSDNILIRQTLDFAQKLEGTVQTSGVHACGVIIGRDDLFDCVPLCTSKNSDILVTQYEGKVIEDAGLLKMDFLGLKTLNIISSTLENIRKRSGEEFEIDDIPLDDEKTFELFANGDTTAIFQFESPGMRTYMQELKPSRFEDIIAMNALYRPGPMDNIPTFINRKLGKEPISYDIPEMGQYLDDTYGITVYQEQVMLLSRLLAGFTRGQADTLRKAMGKKKIDMMNELEVKYMQGGQERDHTPEQLKKIWDEWKHFAEYAFNKSHATCYAFVAFQTAFLKAHYRAEFMAANLTNNLDNMTKISTFIDDAVRSNIKVLGPDINESEIEFTVNKAGNIRFGLAALKGVGASGMENVVKERNENGPYKDIFDFVKRVDLRSCNKRCIETLAKAGAFDCFENMHRAQFFFCEREGFNFVDKLISFASKSQNTDANQISIFDAFEPEEQEELNLPLPQCEPWGAYEQIKNEKEVAGFYITAHPLDEFKEIINNYVNVNLLQIADKEHMKRCHSSGKPFAIAGIVSEVRSGFTKNNKAWGTVTLEDYDSTWTWSLFGDDDFTRFKHMFEKGKRLYIEARMELKQWVDKESGKITERVNIHPISVISLEEVYDKVCKEVVLVLDIGNVSVDVAKDIKKQLDANKGKTDFSLRIVEKGGVFYSDFSNFSTKINPEEFVKSFSLPVKYKIELKK